MRGVIEARALTKVRGTVVAVQGADFVAHPGRVTAFLGPNGSGKTSTFRLVSGLDRPTSGAVSVHGRPLREWPEPARVLGSLVDGTPVHPTWRVDEHLRVLGATHHLGRRQVERHLRLSGLQEIRSRRGRELSLGMRQRLGVAMATLAQPSSLVLDEPANGLDPQAMRWLRDRLVGHAREGGTVLLSSHLMKEVQHLAEDVVIILGGRIVWSSTLTEFVSRHAQETVVVSGPELARLVEALHRCGATVTRRPGHLEVQGVSRDAVGHAAYATCSEISELRSMLPSLEDVYVDFVDGHRELLPPAETGQDRPHPREQVLV